MHTDSDQQKICIKGWMMILELLESLHSLWQRFAGKCQEKERGNSLVMRVQGLGTRELKGENSFVGHL